MRFHHCTIFFSALFVVLLFGARHHVSADGMVFDRGSFEPLQQYEQRAVTILEDGRQSMVIALNLANPRTGEWNNKNGAVWIFPVPGSPEQVKLDVVDSFPLMRGHDVLAGPRQRFLGMALGPLYTNIICAPVILPYSISYKHGRPVPFGQVDKWGIHTETISADSVGSLARYLESKGLRATEPQLRTFEQYCSNNYALVLAWISSREDMLKHFKKDERYPLGSHPCVFAQFPTDKGFYPLVPTSGYGNHRVRVLVYVFGHVTSNRDHLQTLVRKQVGDSGRARLTSHFMGGLGNYQIYSGDKSVDSMPKTLREVLPKDSHDFTKVLYEGPASGLVEDLTFTNNVPAEIAHAQAFMKYTNPRYAPVLIVLFFTAVYSYVSGGLSGLLLYRRWHPHALLGLWNCLTILALALAVRRYRKNAGLPKRHSFTAVFFVVFTAVVIIQACTAYWLLVAL